MERFNRERLLSSVASASERNSNENLHLRKAIRVWDRMQEMFGSSWSSQYGDAPSRTWTQALSHMTDEQIVRGLQRIALGGEKFPPTLPQFIAVCRGEDGGECRTNSAAYVQLPHNPPETDEHKAARKARGREQMERVKAALKGVTYEQHQ